MHIYIYICNTQCPKCVCLLDYVCKLRFQRLGSDKDPSCSISFANWSYQEISVTNNKKILVMYLLESNQGSNAHCYKGDDGWKKTYKRCWSIMKIENNWGESIKIGDVWKWEFPNLLHKEALWNENPWMQEWMNEWVSGWFKRSLGS